MPSTRHLFHLRLRALCTVSLLAICATAATKEAQAASLDWIGGWNGDFGSPGGGGAGSGNENWSNGGVATAADSVTISAARSSTTNAAPGPNNNAAPVVYGNAAGWGSLAGDGRLLVDSNAVFTIGALGQTTTFSGRIENAGGSSTGGTLRLISGGGSTTDFTLSGNSSFNGTFAVDGAIFRLTAGGSLAANLTLTAGSGGIASEAFVAGSLGRDVTNAGTFTLAGTGNVAGTVTNTGTFNASGSIGALVNTSGTTNVDGTLMAGTVDNAGTLLISNGDLVVTGALTNTNALTIAAGRAVTAASITNAAGATWTGDITTDTVTTNRGNWNGAIVNNAVGVLTNDASGTITGRVTNAGSATNSGQLTGGLTNSGRFDALGGSIGGSVINNGTFNFANAATTFSNSFTNAAGGSVVLASGAATTGITTFDNSGSVTFSAAGQAFGATSFNNLAGGLVDATGFGGTIAGNVTNAGVISLQNGSTSYSRFAITGNYTGNGGAIALDIDRSAGASTASRADVIAISGTASGNTLLRFRDVGSIGYFTNPITVVTTGGGSGTFTAANLASNGFIDYALIRTGNDWAVQSAVATAAVAAVPATISSAMTVATTGFSEPVSNVVSRTQLNANGIGAANGAGITTFGARNDPVSVGLWMRSKGGHFNIDSTNTAGATSETSRYGSNFVGVQFGLDARFANLGDSGWNGHLGLTGGDLRVFSRSSTAGSLQSSRADVDAPFYGIYGVLSRNGFFFDAQLQRIDYSMRLDTTSASGSAQLTDQRIGARGYSLQTSAGQVFSLGNDWFIEPTLGFNYATAQIDALQVGIVNVRSDDLTSAVGTAKVKVGTQFSATQDLILKPSVQAGFLQEFAGNATAVATVQGGPSQQVTTSRPGSYGQVAVAVDFQRLGSSTTGFVRSDATFGNDITGVAFTAGVRHQF